MKYKVTIGGFTLIEVLVTTAIIALLATVALPATRATERKTQLRQSASNVRGHLVEARQLALAPTTGSVAIQAYGVRLTQSTGQISLIEIPERGVIRVVRTEALPSEIQIQRIAIGGVSALEVDFIFPINPSVSRFPTQPTEVTFVAPPFTRQLLYDPVSGFAEVR